MSPSLRNLCVLCASAVKFPRKNQSPQRRRDRRGRGEFFFREALLQRATEKRGTSPTVREGLLQNPER